MPFSGNEIVISGISGIFPSSNNVEEFAKNLYDKVDMVQYNDFLPNVKHPDIPKYYGMINGREKFDANFFRVTPNQSMTLDPLNRKILEETYSAIFDAGINPVTLSNTRVGVFTGTSLGDNRLTLLYTVNAYSGHAISGASRNMFANRISYWMDTKSPSYHIDLACCSSMACLEQAYSSIKSGRCDAAIVGACNGCYMPGPTMSLKRAGHLCMDGKTKCFDKNGDGYVRSSAVGVIFLQKAKDAKRIYAEVCHVKGKYFIRPDANSLPLRESTDMKTFFEEFYSEVATSPDEVEYVEANGTGIAEADGKELDAIGQFFGRNQGVKVGSVKSNMGNTEGASGISSLIKVIEHYIDTL